MILKRVSKWVDLRGVLTAVVATVIIVLLTFLGSQVASLDPAIVIAVAVALVVGVALALLDRRTQRVEQALRFPSGPFRGHLRLDHVEGDVALLQARTLLGEPEDRSVAEQSLEHVVAAALLSGFHVEHSMTERNLEKLTFHPPLGSGVPGALTIGLGRPLTESVDTAANWLRTAGAPLAQTDVDDGH